MEPNVVMKFCMTPHSYNGIIMGEALHALGGTCNASCTGKPFTHLNLLKTISALSYSKPELRIFSAIKLASENTGGLRPISVKCMRMLLLN